MISDSDPRFDPVTDHCCSLCEHIEEGILNSASAPTPALWLEKGPIVYQVYHIANRWRMENKACAVTTVKFGLKCKVSNIVI